MAKLMDRVEQGFGLGILYAAVAWGLALVWQRFLTDVPALRITMSTIEVNIRQAMATKPTGALASSLLGLFGINLGLPEVFMIFASSVVLAILGLVIYDFFPVGRSLWQKLTMVFIYGSLAEMLIMAWLSGLNFSAIAWPLLLTKAAYAAIISGLVIWAIKNLDFIPFRVPPLK